MAVSKREWIVAGALVACAAALLALPSRDNPTTSVQARGNGAARVTTTAVEPVPTTIPSTLLVPTDTEAPRPRPTTTTSAAATVATTTTNVYSAVGKVLVPYDGGVWVLDTVEGSIRRAGGYAPFDVVGDTLYIAYASTIMRQPVGGGQEVVHLNTDGPDFTWLEMALDGMPMTVPGTNGLVSPDGTMRVVEHDPYAAAGARSGFQVLDDTGAVLFSFRHTDWVVGADAERLLGGIVKLNGPRWSADSRYVVLGISQA